MSREALRTNIIDFIKEEQIKLGFAKECVRLYYPKASLALLLGTDEDAVDVELGTFVKENKNVLGKIEISSKNDRYCINVPCQGVEYVSTLPKDCFLEDFIKTISNHNCTKEELENVFRKYSDEYTVEEMQDEDFDYSMYFNKPGISDYIYCIKDEGIHLIYHRFTFDDYKKMME